MSFVFWGENPHKIFGGWMVAEISIQIVYTRSTTYSRTKSFTDIMYYVFILEYIWHTMLCQWSGAFCKCIKSIGSLLLSVFPLPANYPVKYLAPNSTNTTVIRWDASCLGHCLDEVVQSHCGLRSFSNFQLGGVGFKIDFNQVWSEVALWGISPVLSVHYRGQWNAAGTACNICCCPLRK